MTDGPEIREPLSALVHDIWVHWMRHLEKQVIWREGIGWVIDEEVIIHWQRQINAGYDGLTDGGKDSDRDQADKILALLKQHSWRKFPVGCHDVDEFYPD